MTRRMGRLALLGLVHRIDCIADQAGCQPFQRDLQLLGLHAEALEELIRERHEDLTIGFHGLTSASLSVAIGVPARPGMTADLDRSNAWGTADVGWNPSSFRAGRLTLIRGSRDRSSCPEGEPISSAERHLQPQRQGGHWIIRQI